MRLGFLIVALVLAIGGYSALRLQSRKAQELVVRPVIRPLPFTVEVTQTPEEKERQEIRDSAISLFTAKDFDALDALARKHRESKEHYADGIWKLSEVYAGLQIDKRSSSDTQWTEHLSALEEWGKTKPSVTARVALADSLVSYAWRARGGDRTVTREGRKLFGERLKQATGVLTEARNEARNLKELCPRWWSVMLQAALGLGVDQTGYDRIFNEAITIDSTYVPYYARKANYLLPRWHGRPGEWEAFIAKAADNIGGEDGDILYARVVWFTHTYRMFSNIFDENHLSWPRTDRGFAALEKRYPDSLAVKSERAYLAGLAGDAKSRTYFDALGGKIDLSVWDTKDNFVEQAQIHYASNVESGSTNQAATSLQ
jgi:hypothetical protein